MVVIATSYVVPIRGAVTLSQYAQYCGIPELWFWGVKRGALVQPKTQYWNGYERQRLGFRLREAERLIAQTLGVYLLPTWTEDERAAWDGRNPTPLNWKHFIAAGVKATSTYGTVTVDYVTDPEKGIATIAHGGVGNEDEVQVFYEGDDVYGPEPLSITFGAANIVIEFPRHRLVDPSLMDEEHTPVDWADDANFIEKVTIKRVYNVTSTQAQVRVSLNCASPSCTQSCDTACVTASDVRLSWINLIPATYSSGSWTARRCFSGTPNQSRVWYYSGLEQLPVGFEDTIIRLAHSLMPEAECPTDKDVHHRFWLRDRNKDTAMTRERVNCPWGPTDGAWAAWMFCEHSPYHYGKGGGLM